MSKSFTIGFNTRWVVIAGGTTDRAPVHDDRSEAEVMDWHEVGGSSGNDYPTSIKVYSTMLYLYLIYFLLKLCLLQAYLDKVDACFVSSTPRSSSRV